MQELLLDTDMLSEIVKGRNAVVRMHARRYRAIQGEVTFSLMTKFQILRGLKRKSAFVQLAGFSMLCAKARILPIDEAVADRAAELWADAMNAGKPADDADLLIASTALENNLPLCTGNTSHFDWIPGIKLLDWRLP
jgi:tRNA(fMet)-specific endonuclease VapC